MTETPWMNTGEVAVYLRVSARHVKRLIKEEGLPFSRIGRRLIFHKQKVDQWIDRNSA